MKKVLALALSLSLILAIGVAGTLAWLTAETDTITNTFTIGKVAITLDEAKLGSTTERTAAGQAYGAIVPGATFAKDPTFHFAAGSEASFLFVKVENGLAGIEANTDAKPTIAAQLTTNGWTALSGEANVYYRAQPTNTGTSAVDIPAFTSVYIGDTANVAVENPTITVKGYAIQQAGVGDVAAAWAKLNP
jgi:predicted ribosomally synthesized peptide with SipW-like signal peptide